MQEKLEKIIHLFYHISYTCFVGKALILNEICQVSDQAQKNCAFNFMVRKLQKHILIEFPFSYYLPTYSLCTVVQVKKIEK